MSMISRSPKASTRCRALVVSANCLRLQVRLTGQPGLRGAGYEIRPLPFLGPHRYRAFIELLSRKNPLAIGKLARGIQKILVNRCRVSPQSAATSSCSSCASFPLRSVLNCPMRTAPSGNLATISS
jgi:hypothetical protein